MSQNADEIMDKVEKKIVGNYQKKKMAAAAHNATIDIAKDILFIGFCSKCGKEGPLAMYLKSEKKNICNYYCLNCGKTNSIKKIDMKDEFLFPMIDIVNEVSKHYDPDVFDEVYNG